MTSSRRTGYSNRLTENSPTNTKPLICKKKKKKFFFDSNLLIKDIRLLTNDKDFSRKHNQFM